MYSALRHALSQANTIYPSIAVALVVLFCFILVPRSPKYKLFPVWATIEVAIGSYVLCGDGLGHRVFSLIRRYKGSLFGISSTHQILVNLPNIDRLLSQSLHVLTAEPVQYTLFTRVFGGRDSPSLKKKLQNSWKDLLAPIERLFLNDAAAAAAIDRAGVSWRSNCFVTFSRNRSKMQRWELSADVKLAVPSTPGESRTVEANLQSLTRDFGACMAIPLLYGQEFFDQYPRLLDDFWKFDNDTFPLLMLGIPEWAPLKIMREGIAARTRILSELEALYRRIDRKQTKEEILGPRVDACDVSSVVLGRNNVYRREGWSFAERGAGDFAVLWGQNANTHPVLFWLLTYVYSTPDILERVREEIEPYIQMTDAAPLQITSMDLPALSRGCQFLKACIFETYRMVNEPTSIRYVETAITIKDGELNHQLKPGTFISVPHSLIQQDPGVFANPEQFIPDRFLEIDAKTGNQVARYGKLKPWGSGVSMCKGRTFAEKELTSLGAAIISLWDISPANGKWKLPAMIPGTGVKRPVADIRVRISRRALK